MIREVRKLMRYDAFPVPDPLELWIHRPARWLGWAPSEAISRDIKERWGRK